MTDAASVWTQFDPATAAWFSGHVGTPTAVQQEAWPAIAKGGHVLIAAPTGTGKTLSAFLVFIDRMKAQARQEALAQGVQLIYVSPLKALGNDIRENLRRPLDGIAGPEIDAAIRTGDTTQAERRRMLKHPPSILITTPESLYLLLTSRGGQQMLQTARAVILDELHAVINSKRGAHLMLSLARLDALCEQPLQRIGLSATIEPLAQAAQYLGAPDPVAIVAPPMHKDVSIEVNAPLEDMRSLPEGTIWPEIARQVYDASQSVRTVIAFVEGRAQAEKLAYYVNLLGGEGYARTHHGCVSKEQRLQAEQQLRRGELRVLCATSSMELGIDVGEVDLVVQLGFPRTVASTMQRLGRAGHNPGRTSVMHMYPRTASDCVLCGLTASVALAGGIEQSHPPRKCLDVLAQHMVSMAAVAGVHTVGEVLALSRRAYPFRDVTEEEIRSLLGMLAGDYEHAADHPARARLLYDRIHGTFEGDAYSRMLALGSGGTIPDRGMLTARLADGTRLGELDEEFVFEARIGDKFLLGAFAWRVDEFRQDSVIVSPTSPEGAQTPFWKGDWSGRSAQTGRAFGRMLRGLSEAHAAGSMRPALQDMCLDDWAVGNAAHLLARQIKATGCLPDDRTILVEHFQDSAGDHQLMVHSVFGGRVNAGLAVLMQETVHRKTGMDVSCFDDDDGFLIFPFGSSTPMPEGLLHAIDPQRAEAMLAAMLPATPLFNMAFRYNAARALMMGVRNGRRQPLWVQRLRGAQTLDEAIKDPSHPLIVETRRECLEDYWDLPAIRQVLQEIRAGVIAVREVHLATPSPMALPLRRLAESVLMYEYSPTPAGVHRSVAEALSQEAAIAPAPEQLERVSERGRLPQDEGQLHALLMAEGDLVAGEVDVPLAWLESLARKGRAAYIEPGLWIGQEQAEQYEQALREGDMQARGRIVRRCLRYRGAQSVDSLSERYFWTPEEAQAVLGSLLADSAAVQDGEMYFHAELYSRAQRATIAMRRRQVKTQPPERYAALLASTTRVNAGAEEQLMCALDALAGQAFAPALWESVLLPARCAGYKPAMLDALLAQGVYYWQMLPGERAELAFFPQEAIDWESDILATAADLSPQDSRLVDALMQRGASFAQSLSGVLEGRAPLDTLMDLAARGLVHADSFVPVRQWLSADKTARSASARVRTGARVITALSGRWELSRPRVGHTLEDWLRRALERTPLICRETAGGLPWGQALEILRVWEYTGQVRRGYFVKGLSGAQFVRADRFEQVTLALEQPREGIVWLNAADPAQPWGKAVSHLPGRAFMNIPATAVALDSGVPVATLERHGHTLRVFDLPSLPQALGALARDYAQGRVFSQLARIVIKEYPPEARDALEASAFTRQMLDYELWQKKI